jgi:hypothetical protein
VEVHKVLRRIGKTIEVIVEWPVYLGGALLAAANRAPVGRRIFVVIAGVLALGLLVFYFVWLLSPTD